MKVVFGKYISAAFFLLFVVVGFSSCEVTVFDEPPYYVTPEEYLCGPVWTDIWDENYHRYEQRFVFYRDGRGVEYFADNGEEWRYEFYWNWDRGGYNSIRMDYVDGTSYFDNLIIERGRLRGYLNNEYVEFVAR